MCRPISPACVPERKTRRPRFPVARFDTRQVDVAFRVMWADHGDEVSNQYAGTGAMKSAFTRTGKRDIWGLLDDGAKSLTRWVGTAVFLK